MRFCILTGINIQVHLAHHEVNSYTLMKHADHIVVSASTVGLEALAIGKPVTTLWDTFYDIANEMVPWEIGIAERRRTEDVISRAELFITGMVLSDLPLEPVLFSSGSRGAIDATSRRDFTRIKSIRRIATLVQTLYNPVARLNLQLWLRPHLNVTAGRVGNLVLRLSRFGSVGRKL